MKGAVVFFALVALAFSAPQPRKVFHENFEDFVELIVEVAGEEMGHIIEHYAEFEEFGVSMNYLKTADFKNLAYEMESLPEFKAVIEFLEQDNIDILYFLDRFNTIMEYGFDVQKKSRHELSGRDFNAFVNDCIDIFPKEQLAALYEQKLADDDEFRVAMENLSSEEWDRVYGALWQSEKFQAEIKTLAENGIEMQVLLRELMAVFGQN